MISPFFNQLLHNSEQIMNLIKLRDILLPRLISGQLIVNNLKNLGEFHV